MALPLLPRDFARVFLWPAGGAAGGAAAASMLAMMHQSGFPAWQAPDAFYRPVVSSSVAAPPTAPCTSSRSPTFAAPTADHTQADATDELQDSNAVVLDAAGLHETEPPPPPRDDETPRPMMIMEEPGPPLPANYSAAVELLRHLTTPAASIEKAPGIPASAGAAGGSARHLKLLSMAGSLFAAMCAARARPVAGPGAHLAVAGVLGVFSMAPCSGFAGGETLIALTDWSPSAVFDFTTGLVHPGSQPLPAWLRATARPGDGGCIVAGIVVDGLGVDLVSSSSACTLDAADCAEGGLVVVLVDAATASAAAVDLSRRGERLAVVLAEE
jgi:hypothetical protein